MDNRESKRNICHVDYSREIIGELTCQTSASYERDMNKYLTIIYHNISRLQEDKRATARCDSIPHDQFKKFGPPERASFQRRENSVSAGFMLGLTDSSFIRCPPQHSCNSKSFKRRVTFSNPQELKIRPALKKWTFWWIKVLSGFHENCGKWAIDSERTDIRDILRYYWSRVLEH